MSLKLKIILLISAIFITYGLMGFAIQRHVILPSFAELERREAIDNTERIIEALDREVSLLIPSATDWGTWDDTYNYMMDRNEAYSVSNLNSTTLEGLKINFLGFYENDGRKVWGLAYDLESAESLELGDFSMNSLSANHPLLDSPGAENTVAGLYPTPQGAMLVVSRPILPSSTEAASRGRIVIGRLLNANALNRLSDQAKVKIHYRSSEPNQQTGLQPIIKTGYVAHSAIILSEMPATLIGSSTLYGLNNTAVLYLEMETPRTISAHGKRALNYAISYFISSGIIVLTLLLLLLRRTLFVPVARFIRHVTEIGAKGDLSARIAMKRKDEIGILADQFDRMIALLAETRQKLLDQSYHSGMAEIASGVLHNIGNAITPLGIKVSKIKHDLQQSPIAEIGIATGELANPSTAADRRADLAQFLQLASSELTAVNNRTAADLKAIQTQIEYINTILSDQRRFSRAEKVFEPLQIGQLVGEVVQLLPEELLRHITIIIEPDLTTAGCVRSVKVALQQVISNLLANAAESIQESGKNHDNGRIRVSVAQELHDSKPFMHLLFEDNGVGIAQENIAHLFEPRFSTKPRQSGMGLHWSANTVASLGGRLYAESAGPGLGASFHLLLPLEALPEQSTIHAQEIAA
jgi:sensor domain CHASE-containing protein